jgi:hypothetical protein
MTTTREHFGIALAAIVGLYKAAEERGDASRVHHYAVAVDALLDAWPADQDLEEQSAPTSDTLRALRTSGADWDSRIDPEWEEPTLVGLGMVEEGQTG